MSLFLPIPSPFAPLQLLLLPNPPQPVGPGSLRGKVAEAAISQLNHVLCLVLAESLGSGTEPHSQHLPPPPLAIRPDITWAGLSELIPCCCAR